MVAVVGFEPMPQKRLGLKPECGGVPILAEYQPAYHMAIIIMVFLIAMKNKISFTNLKLHKGYAQNVDGHLVISCTHVMAKIFKSD